MANGSKPPAAAGPNLFSSIDTWMEPPYAIESPPVRRILPWDI